MFLLGFYEEEIQASSLQTYILRQLPLCEMWPNMEFFLVRIFPQCQRMMHGDKVRSIFFKLQQLIPNFYQFA